MSSTPSSPPDPWRPGTVTRSTPAWPVPPALPPAQLAARAPRDDARRQRRTLLLFGGAAGALLVIGVVVLLVVVLTGENLPLRRRYPPPPDIRPPLAQLCPPPSGAPARPAPPGTTSAPAGPRTTDREAGISYREYGEPWLPWRSRWSAGTLQVVYAIGQHFVTETYPGGSYHASILSGRVPATVNDSVSIDLECTGRQIAADVRASYYPQPNRMEVLRDQRTVLGGLPGWLTKFRLHFSEQGLAATNELVGVVVIDVGRPEAAILYVSIPNTHARFDGVVDEVLASVRRA